MDATPARELPRYRSHKIVWALKIAAIVKLTDGSLRITPVEEGYDQFTVPKEYVPIHEATRPSVGWFWVKYKDGYQSFSPPEAFEEGYDLIP